MYQAGPARPLADAPLLGYASVSGREGSIINLELREQAETIVAECESLGLELLQVVSEREPARGKGLKRPGLEYALTHLRAGKAGGLMVCDLARLTRSAAQLGAILEWFVGHRRRLISIGEEIDTSLASGQLAARAVIGLSNRERERITSRTRRGLEVARSNLAAARRPAVTDDPYLRDRIREMRERNMSLQAIADALNAEGVPTVRGGAKWRPSSLQSVTGYRRKRPELVAMLSDDLAPETG